MNIKVLGVLCVLSALLLIATVMTANPVASFMLGISVYACLDVLAHIRGAK